MTIVVPRINRLPMDQRGITLADFLVPIRLGERVGPRARHVALIVAGALLIALTAQLTIVQQGQTIPIVADFRITLATRPCRSPARRSACCSSAARSGCGGASRGRAVPPDGPAAAGLRRRRLRD